MAKIFDWLKPEANPETNAFDVSRRDTFSTSPGIINAIRPRVIGPKSQCRINVADSVINTLGMVNQPFNRGQFVMDFYQVPIQQVMSDFNTFYTQLLERFDSFSDPEGIIDAMPQVPHVDLWTLVCTMAFDTALYLSYNDDVTYEQGATATSTKFKTSWFEGDGLNPETSSTPITTLPFVMGLDVHGYPRALGAWRLLDLLGYGNIYLFFKDCWLNFSTTYGQAPEKFENNAKAFPCLFLVTFIRNMYDMFIQGDDTTDAYDDAFSEMLDNQYNRVSSVVINGGNCSIDVLYDLEQFNFSGPSYGGKREMYANSLNFFAYQKVFNDIYRNSFYDKIPPIAFNADWFVSKSLERNADVCELFHEAISAHDDVFPHDYGDNTSRFVSFWQIFEIRYRQFKKDMFTSLLPNSQFGDVSMVNVGDSVFNLKVNNPDMVSNPTWTGVPLGVNRESKKVGTGTGTSDGYNTAAQFVASNLSFNVLMARRAEALQKYKERYLRAGNRLKDQYVSSFGKVPYYLGDKYVRYLGSVDTRLNVQGVPATSDSGEYNVGERGSYGYCGINGNIELGCDDWSIVVPIFYYLPEVDYEAFGLEGCNKFSVFSDYYVPEFENLGLEPVYRTTLSQYATRVQNMQLLGGERVIGYGPAYMYFKTDVDKVHGEFGSTADLHGVFHSWISTRGNVSMSELSDYYVRPDFANNVMRQQYLGVPSSDQFLCVLNLDWRVIEPLSVVGLPIWN